MVLKDLLTAAQEYIRCEENLGTPTRAIQARLSPFEYPNLPASQIDALIADGVYEDRGRAARSISVKFCALAPYDGHEYYLRVCARDEGLASRDELVREIVNTIAQQCRVEGIDVPESLSSALRFTGEKSFE